MARKLKHWDSFPFLSGKSNTIPIRNCRNFNFKLQVIHVTSPRHLWKGERNWLEFLMRKHLNHRDWMWGPLFFCLVSYCPWVFLGIFLPAGHYWISDVDRRWVKQLLLHDYSENSMGGNREAAWCGVQQFGHLWISKCQMDSEVEGLDFAVGTAGCETTQGQRTSEADFILYY